MSARQFYLRSYPIPDGMAAHAAAVEQGGWDGLLLTDSQNLSMDVFASLGIAAAATSTLQLGTAVTNLTTRHPAVVPRHSPPCTTSLRVGLTSVLAGVTLRWN